VNAEKLKQWFEKQYPHFKYGCTEKTNRHGLTCDEMFHRWLNEDDYVDPIYNKGETWGNYPISQECKETMGSI
jgi:hypothetical protein